MSEIDAVLKLFDATLSDSCGCHLHYYDFRLLFEYDFFFFWTLNKINFPQL